MQPMASQSSLTSSSDKSMKFLRRRRGSLPNRNGLACCLLCWTASECPEPTEVGFGSSAVASRAFRQRPTRTVATSAAPRSSQHGFCWRMSLRTHSGLCENWSASKANPPRSRVRFPGRGRSSSIISSRGPSSVDRPNGVFYECRVDFFQGIGRLFVIRFRGRHACHLLFAPIQFHKFQHPLVSSKVVLVFKLETVVRADGILLRRPSECERRSGGEALPEAEDCLYLVLIHPRF